MSQTVTIKSTKAGIHLILDPEQPFGELLHAVSEKFAEAAKFFGKAKLAISFEGRDLSQGESFRIIEAIMAHTDVTILCIVDEDPRHATLFRQQTAAYFDMLAGKEGVVFRGSLKAGQTLMREESIILVGDVYAGAEISSAGNLMILGSLQGTAQAGLGGNEAAFVTALEMAPQKLIIGERTAFVPPQKIKGKKLRFKEKQPVELTPQMARIKGTEICIMDAPTGISL